MKHLFFLLMLFTLSCTTPTDKQSEKVIDTENPDNEELTKMHNEDQADRRGIIDWSVVSVRDSTRLARVNEMVAQDLLRTGKDYYHAAMIYQHGPDTISSAMAVKMMRKAVDLDRTVNKWLLAAAIDRDLMYRNQPQIFGTQYVRSGEYEPWERYEIDSTKVTDEERIEYGVETLAEQRLKTIRMNQKKLPELLAEGKTIDEIIDMIRNDQTAQAEYDLSENAINSFGYRIMNDQGPEEALPVFELNTQLYPDAWNTFDSLGECLLALNRKQEAVAAYQRSLELNPENDTAREVIEKHSA